jgi:hypothetical protein
MPLEVFGVGVHLSCGILLLITITGMLRVQAGQRIKKELFMPALIGFLTLV